jgi:hypothetical protein
MEFKRFYFYNNNSSEYTIKCKYKGVKTKVLQNNSNSFSRFEPPFVLYRKQSLIMVYFSSKVLDKSDDLGCNFDLLIIP